MFIVTLFLEGTKEYSKFYQTKQDAVNAGLRWLAKGHDRAYTVNYKEV